MKLKSALKNNLISLLDETFPGIDTLFERKMNRKAGRFGCEILASSDSFQLFLNSIFLNTEEVLLNAMAVGANTNKLTLENKYMQMNKA